MNAPDWQRLSPWSVVSFTLKAAKELLMQAYTLVPIIYTGWTKGFDSPLMMLLIFAILIGILINGMVQYFTFRFRAGDDKLEVRRGLFFVRRDELPLDKIQNIRLEQPFYFKPLSLCNLVIETAGSKDSEVSIVAMSHGGALTLKAHLLGDARSTAPWQTLALEKETESVATSAINDSLSAARSNNSQSPDKSQSSDKAENLDKKVISRNARDLIRFGFYHNNLIWLAVFAGSLLGQIPVHDMIERLGLEAASQWQSKGPLLVTLLSIALVIAGYLLLCSLSVLFALLKYFPYSLHLLHANPVNRAVAMDKRHSKKEPTLERRGGVIAHQQDAVAMRRVQQVAFNQPPLARLIGRWTVLFHQVEGNDVERFAKLPMLVPALTPEELPPLMACLSALPGGDATPPSVTSLLPIHRAWFYRQLAVPLLFTAAVSLIAMNTLIGELALSAALLLSLGFWLRYRHYGYLLSDELLWLRTGLLGHSIVRIPLSKVQHVSMTQSPWQRKHHLASLDIGLASGVQRLPWVPLEYAKAIADKSLHLTRQDRSNWI